MTTSRKGWNLMTDEEKQRVCVDSIQVTNLVSTMTLTGTINVQSIAKRNIGINYRPEFGSIALKLKEPACTATIYSTGVAVFMGASTTILACLAAYKIIRLLNKYSSDDAPLISMKMIQVHNIAASVLSFPLNLNKMMEKWSHAIEIHEGFAGITLNCACLSLETNIAMEIFTESGKINITGAKCEADITKIYTFVHKNILAPAEIVMMPLIRGVNMNKKQHPRAKKRAPKRKRVKKYYSDADSNGSGNEDGEESEHEAEDDIEQEDEEEEEEEEENKRGKDYMDNSSYFSQVTRPGSKRTRELNSHVMISHAMHVHQFDEEVVEDEENELLDEELIKAIKNIANGVVP